MDRREAMLRELNLYPQWVRRNQPAPVSAEQPAPVSAEQPVPITEQLVSVPVVTPTPLVPPLARAVVRKEDEVSARTEKNNIQTGPSAATPASQVDQLGWAELKQMVRDCTACKLRAGCTQTVFGVGDEKAEWLFVGEGPGADEDVQGEPFVGQAGKLLDNMLMAIKLKRGKSVYIANIVKCRPPENRTPATDEIAQCMPYLQRQIALIQPKLIVALGKVASNALLGKDATLASLRGKLHDYHGIPLIVTYHPAYLLRTPSEKAKAWQDLILAVKTKDGVT
jgi:uracil-DNA glycosylase family 4